MGTVPRRGGFAVRAKPAVPRPEGRQPTTRGQGGLPIAHFDPKMIHSSDKGFTGEAATTQAPTSADFYPDLQTPGKLCWWDGSWRVTTPTASGPFESVVDSTSTPALPPPHLGLAPVPELVVSLAPDQCQGGEMAVERQELEEEVAHLRQALAEQVTNRDQIKAELSDLKSQIPRMRYERDELRSESSDLNSAIRRLRDERDELLAVVTPLRAEVPDLRLRRQELTLLISRNQSVRRPSPSTGKLWSLWPKRPEIHDS